MSARPLLLAALALVPVGAGAQDRASEVQVEPARERGHDAVGVEQLGTPADRAVPPVQRRDSGRAPPQQLAPVGERRGAEQVGNGQQRSAAPAPALSSRAEGKPPAAAPLGGSDRCAPGTQEAREPRCQQILERRAAEFTAPKAPTVSPEAALLALDRGPAGLAQAGQSERKLRGTDADDPLNQELAAVVVAGQTPPPQPEPKPQDAALSEAIAQFVAQLQAGTK